MAGHTGKGTNTHHNHLVRKTNAQPQFQKLLTPGKINTVLCLGNLTSTSIYHFLRGLAPNFHAVKGDFDTEVFPALGQPPQHAQHPDFNARPVPPPVGATAPLTKVIQHADLKIGMVHGHTVVPTGDADILLNTARQLDVDVLLWGGTHRFEAYEMEGRFFVNPGSATGALGTGWWSDGEEPTPSFCLMDVRHLLLQHPESALILAHRSKVTDL